MLKPETLPSSDSLGSKIEEDANASKEIGNPTQTGDDVERKAAPVNDPTNAKLLIARLIESSDEDSEDDDDDAFKMPGIEEVEAALARMDRKMYGDTQTISPGAKLI